MNSMKNWSIIYSANKTYLPPEVHGRTQLLAILFELEPCFSSYVQFHQVNWEPQNRPSRWWTYQTFNNEVVWSYWSNIGYDLIGRNAEPRLRKNFLGFQGLLIDRQTEIIKEKHSQTCIRWYFESGPVPKSHRIWRKAFPARNSQIVHHQIFHVNLLGRNNFHLQYNHLTGIRKQSSVFHDEIQQLKNKVFINFEWLHKWRISLFSIINVP